jgi:UDP-2,4-diacetamido-2,4,6-trideoxy-beta-L-altropyranose hydrolase
MGQGHVIRCVTLANVLRESGAEINFVSREHPGHLCELVAQRGDGSQLNVDNLSA